MDTRNYYLITDTYGHFLEIDKERKEARYLLSCYGAWRRGER